MYTPNTTVPWFSKLHDPDIDASNFQLGEFINKSSFSNHISVSASILTMKVEDT